MFCQQWNILKKIAEHSLFPIVSKIYTELFTDWLDFSVTRPEML